MPVLAMSLILAACAGSNASNEATNAAGKRDSAAMRNDAFERFVEAYPADGALGFSAWTERDTVAMLGRDVPEYTQFQRRYARPSFGDGLIRFVGDDDVGARGLPAFEWNGPGRWRTAWPGRPQLAVFAYDWLARQYALDAARLSAGGEPLVSLLDPDDGAVLESEMTFRELIELLAGSKGERILDKRLYATWRAAGGAAPGPRQCVAYKHPLVVGGKRTVENMELGDMDVHLTLMAQHHEQLGAPMGR
ncbi:MAG: DUF1851 domain-containing protein [Myxococcales bacterium]|nr:DUF1851 domain-containing protein [Myxococcales bacterium]